MMRLFFLLLLLPLAAPAQDTYLRIHAGYGRAAFFPDDVEDYTGATAFNIGIFRERVHEGGNEIFTTVFLSRRIGLEYRRLEATSAVPTERGIESYSYSNLEIPYVFTLDFDLIGQDVFLIGAELGAMVGVPLSMQGEHRTPDGRPAIRAFSEEYERPVVYLGGQADAHVTVNLKRLIFRLGYGGQLPFVLIARPAPDDQGGAEMYKAIGLRSGGFSAAVSLKLK